MSMTEEQRARMERMKKVAQEKKKWKERAALNEGEVGSEAPAVSAGSVGAKLANPTSSFYNSQAAPPPPLPRGNFRPQEQTSAFQHQVKVCSLDLCQQFYVRNSPQVITATCSLTSRSRFEVVAAYHAPLIEIFKSIASGQYNSNTRVWSFALFDHDLLLQKSRGLAPGLIVTPLPPFVRDAFRKQTDASAHLSIDLSRVEPHLRDQLMPFQKEGVQYGISRQGRVMIADDMGLGKTVQALGLASHYRDAWPLLIIAPSSMRFIQGCNFYWIFTFPIF